jgi:hypothetical protein
MKRETLRELGKGFINLGNIVGGFSGLYSLFHIGRYKINNYDYNFGYRCLWNRCFVDK